MSYKEIPPKADFPLAEWSSNASHIISESAAELDVPAQLAADFAALTVSYQAALSKAKAPATRGPLATSDKERAKTDLLVLARGLCKMIGGNPNVTDHQREELGMHIRKPRTPGHAPTDQADLDILARTSTSVKFRAHNGDKLVRRLPDGVIGMLVWTSVGPLPPANFADWTMHRLFTRPTQTIDFGDNIAPGSKVWIAVRWVNGHGMGPVSVPVEVRLSGQTFAEQMAQQGLPLGEAA